MIIISIISSVLAGMGLGGGAVFIVLSTNIIEIGQHEAQALNLLLFLASGIGATIYNYKNYKPDKVTIKKLLPFLIIGAIIGTFISNSINEQNLKKYFSFFMLIIGIYEIISSLITLKKQKI